jgi:hypothetical protein
MRNALASILLFWLTSIDGVSFSAEEVYSQTQRNSFHKGFYEGCLDKQSRSEMNSYILPTVIDESCKCLADKATADVFGSKEYQLALSRKDSQTALRIISQVLASETVISDQMACLQSSIERRGGWLNSLKEGSSLQLSTKIGLAGEDRRAYIAGGMLSCTTTQRQMPANKNLNDNLIKSYCKCAMNYSADRISQATMVEILKQTPSAVKLLQEQQIASFDLCIDKLTGVNGKDH